MNPPARVRVYMACSLDGYIAGPDNDLSWLHRDHSRDGDLVADPAALQFDAFMKQVGAMLMGRTTYDVVAGFGEWPDGQMPILVATRRGIEPVAESVRPVSGDIHDLVAQAREVAGDRDVYLDGGDLIRQALNAGLVDEITATFVPILLGAGTRLFDGLLVSTPLQFVGHHAFGQGMLQVTARIIR